MFRIKTTSAETQRSPDVDVILVKARASSVLFLLIHELLALLDDKALEVCANTLTRKVVNGNVCSLLFAVGYLLDACCSKLKRLLLTPLRIGILFTN